MPNSVQLEFEDLSKLIGNFITRTAYKSYDELDIVPEENKKCFAAVSQSNRVQWYRGYIERVYRNTEQCTVRLMDKGCARDLFYTDIYPHRRLDLNQIAKSHDLNKKFTEYNNHGLKLNYLSIRCCLFQNANKCNLDKFKKIH